MKNKHSKQQLEEKILMNVKKRLAETGWRGESTRSYSQGNLTSIPEFVIDELSDDFVNRLGVRILAQIRVQPLEPATRRNLENQLKKLLDSMKKDLKSVSKSHLDRFFQVY